MKFFGTNSTEPFPGRAAAGSTYGGPAATGVFFARNTEQYVFGGDQEELTTDAGWANYFGSVSPSADGRTLTMASDPSYPVWCDPTTGCRYLDSNRTGAAVYVLAGQGAGQMRVVTGGGTAYNRSWEIDRPFGGSGGGVRVLPSIGSSATRVLPCSSEARGSL